MVFSSISSWWYGPSTDVPLGPNASASASAASAACVSSSSSESAVSASSASLPSAAIAVKVEEVVARVQEKVVEAPPKERKQHGEEFFASLVAVKTKEDYISTIQGLNWGSKQTGEAALDKINEVLLKALPAGSLANLGLDQPDEASPEVAAPSAVAVKAPVAKKPSSLNVQPLELDIESEKEFPSLSSAKSPLNVKVNEEYTPLKSHKPEKDVETEKLLPAGELAEIILNQEPILRRGAFRKRNQERIKDVYGQIRSAMGEKDDNSMAALQVLKLCKASVLEPLVTETAEKLKHPELGIALFMGSRQRRPKVSIDTISVGGKVIEGKGEGSQVKPSKELAFVKISYSAIYQLRVKERDQVAKVQLNRTITMSTQELFTGILTKASVEDRVEITK